MVYVLEPVKASQHSTRLNLDPDAPDHPEEEGEAMDEVNDDDAAMMAMMGVAGFGSTKVCLFSNPVKSMLTIISIGKTCSRKPRRWGQHKKRTDMEAVHEQVRPFDYKMIPLFIFLL